MLNMVDMIGLYVCDQDEVFDFYVGMFGFEVYIDVCNGGYCWLIVCNRGQQGFQLGLFVFGLFIYDVVMVQVLWQLVVKGVMLLLVLVVDDCRVCYVEWQVKGVEFIQEFIECYGVVDVGFCDLFGNGWKMIEV